jgi:hypothetical protein
MPPSDHPRAVARLASRQHGVVAVWQLLGLGIRIGAIKHWAETGRLHRLHRGVYAVGHRKLEWRGVLIAAVPALGHPA